MALRQAAQPALVSEQSGMSVVLGRAEITGTLTPGVGASSAGFWEVTEKHFERHGTDRMNVKEALKNDQTGIAIIAALYMTVAFGGILSPPKKLSQASSDIEKRLVIAYFLCMFLAGLFSSMAVITSTFKYLRINLVHESAAFKLVHVMETRRCAWIHNSWVFAKRGVSMLCIACCIGIYLQCDVWTFIACLCFLVAFLVAYWWLCKIMEDSWQHVVKTGTDDSRQGFEQQPTEEVTEFLPA